MQVINQKIKDCSDSKVKVIDRLYLLLFSRGDGMMEVMQLWIRFPPMGVFLRINEIMKVAEAAEMWLEWRRKSGNKFGVNFFHI